MFQAASMRNLKDSQFLISFTTAERNVVPNAARNIPSPLAGIKKQNNKLK
jgi:hypothetical protein